MKKYQMVEKEDYLFIEHKDGKNLGIAKSLKHRLIEVDGYIFKDLNGNGQLDAYEDWRLPNEVRIADLVKRMSVEDIAGLMLYSQHQAVSSSNNMFTLMFGGTYDGKSLKESNHEVYHLTDQQKKFLSEDHLRHILLTTVDDAQTSAKWNNQVQAFVEGLDLGIPVNISSDPRHTPSANSEYNAGAGGDISKWPEPLGLAATFDCELVRKFGQIASKEYRMLGITTALSPQVDMASDPRWMRFCGTFGEDSQLSAHMAEAYCDGFQTSEATLGWGNESVNAMVKHWPGGGSGESGRDAHFSYGKFAVYPGSNFDEHLIPFIDGAFNLRNQTKKASAVMPYYTISYDIDQKNQENVGNSYSKYLIMDLLREKYQYDGVVCTDWGITKDCLEMDSFLSGKCWGVEKLSVGERHYKILMAGVDQFGGNNEIQPVLDAYQLGVNEHGEAFMRERFEASGKRLLANIFNTGLFENPYVDAKIAAEVVGNQEFMKAGYEAQLKSIVLLKNKNHVLPMTGKKKVYIPSRRIKESKDWFGHVIDAHEIFPVDRKLVEKYFVLCETPQEADFGLVFIESPNSVGFSKEKGYQPISLQYRPYQTLLARKESLAQDTSDEIVNRSYFGVENTCSNDADLDIILETREAMPNKPIIVAMDAKNPCVVAEFEEVVDAMLIGFNVQNQAILDILSGQHVPSGLLPFQMPKNMDVVELQKEDVSHDMPCHVDCEGNCYDFAYGLDFQGIIQDERVSAYKKN